MAVEIYTDGGCSGNPGPGGWAFVIINEKGDTLESSGGERITTNNRMELTAVIKALEKYSSDGNKNSPKISTDSQYVQLGITKWMISWLKNGWKTADGKMVKNQDLWIRLKCLSDLVHPEWNWIKGHSGNTYNEICDYLVKRETDKIRKT